MKNKHLSIKEKRDWLADIFRNDSGEFSQSERFKAMVEDTRLAMLPDQQEDKTGEKKQNAEQELMELFSQLPKPFFHDKTGQSSIG